MVSNRKRVTNCQKQSSHCPDCGLYVDAGIECFKCDFWFHADCEGLSKDSFRKFSDPKFTDWKWFCRKCSGDMFVKINELEEKLKNYDQVLKRLDDIELLLKGSSIEKRLGDFHTSIEQIKTERANDMTYIKTELECFNVEHNKIKEATDAQNTALIECIATQPKTDPIIREVLRETEDRIRRSRNILILNAPEPNKENSSSRRKADRDLAESVIRQVSLDGEIKICHTHRVGKWNNATATSKERPLLMVLQNATQRDSVLKNAHIIKKAMRPLCIRPDYAVSKKSETKRVSSEPKVNSNGHEVTSYSANKISKNGHVPRIKLTETQKQS
jgi:hypothetical protein